MTNEQLAALAQQGDRRALFDLWEAVKPFCIAAAGHVYRRHEPREALRARRDTGRPPARDLLRVPKSPCGVQAREQAYKFTTYLSYR